MASKLVIVNQKGEFVVVNKAVRQFRDLRELGQADAKVIKSSLLPEGAWAEVSQRRIVNVKGWGGGDKFELSNLEIIQTQILNSRKKV